MKKINWKVRLKNSYFWFGLIAIVLAAVDAKPEMFTSWAILVGQGKLFSNPFAWGCVIIAVVGYINDPTTQGITDSKQAWTYKYELCRNDNSIGAEMCSEKDNNEQYYINQTTQNRAVQLIRVLMK